MQEREQLKSRLGFLLLSAGCAIGIGNVWKFPYMAGQGGGGMFVLLYILFLLILGIPIMTMEFSVGRASKKSPVRSFKQLEKPGTKWHIHGYVSLVGNYIIMMFYTTVAGWMLYYFYLTATGRFTGFDAQAISGVFDDMKQNPVVMVTCMVIVVVVGVFVCSIGVQNGLEKVSKAMMTSLLIIMLVLAVNSFFMDGSKEGLSFFLIPDLGRMSSVGIGKTIVYAMNQAFFTLSVGIGSMAIFGSYIGKDRSLMGESVHVIVLDTFVAVIAGVIMFCACFTYGLEVNAGPSLLFDTMATVFSHMPGGRWWGALFFLFMVFAEMSTVLGVCENILAMVRELTGWSRPKGCVVCAAGIFVLALTTALGYSVIKFQPFAEGTAWLDLWDFIVSNNILPLGSLVLALFCCNKFGWGWDKFVEEANTGKGLKIKSWMKPIFKYFVPAAILFIYIYGMINFQWK